MSYLYFYILKKIRHKNFSSFLFLEYLNVICAGLLVYPSAAKVLNKKIKKLWFKVFFLSNRKNLPKKKLLPLNSSLSCSFFTCSFCLNKRSAISSTAFVSFGFSWIALFSSFKNWMMKIIKYSLYRFSPITIS